MAEPSPELKRALAHIEPRWDGARTERTLAALEDGRIARSRARGLGLGTAAALAVAAAAWLLLSPAAQPAERATPALPGAESGGGASARRIQFADGSLVELQDDDARIVVDEVSPAALGVSLHAGRARFEVVPNPQRAFRVRSGEVTVEVLGTVFELQREGARTHVEVKRGRVAVRWSSGATELAAGGAGWFPLDANPAAEVLPTNDAEPVPARAPRKPASTAASRDWREHAEDGEFGRAYELLERAEHRVADDVQELLLAADAARLSGHPAQAVPFLRQVVEQHATDPRASLAAFTLGGVLMSQLGRPREAEAAYARASALSLSDTLTQDAVARQVEAAHRAGDAARARKLALEYLARYPSGRRLNAVRRFGGLQ